MNPLDSNWTNHSPEGSVASLVIQMIRLPMVAIVYGMEIFVKSVHGFQRIADQSVSALTEPGEAASPAAGKPFGRLSQPSVQNPIPAISTPAPVPVPAATGVQQQKPEEVHKEQIKMPDTNLNDDMLKLVRYKILFIKRDYEWAFREEEELVWDNMTDTAFTAWKVAEFIQRLRRTPRPEKWIDKYYPPRREEGREAREEPDRLRGESEEARAHREAHRREVEEENRHRENIDYLPEADKKFLRVYYEVIARYTREKFKHDERQIEVLEEIRNELRR